ncbi:MAG: 16S rRNA (cytosine(1402)-N(4))-methyltransferase RsmH [Eubacteriaceae bacterium]|nr:16S rRNA (cytosine(1402)-N(4))-methyltransferase RsmH [Eubacteriaceae bacterium]
MANHIPVMYTEVLESLDIKTDGIYLDMTLGGFGHGRGICEMLGKDGLYIGLDLDSSAIIRASSSTGGLKCETAFIQTHFSRFVEILAGLGVKTLDGILMDLGISSYQLEESGRGFSFNFDELLDMRMDTSSKLSAYEIVNTYSQERLADIIESYGEERFAKRIAARIAQDRKSSPIKTTGQLAKLCAQCIPARFHVPGRNPATKVFQALRIEANDLLSGLGDTVRSAIAHLNEGGRISIISFHSLEDRAVKQAFAEAAKGCVCPKELPVCVCNHLPEIKLLTKKPLAPSSSEIVANPRARSAKLRVASKLVISDM